MKTYILLLALILLPSCTAVMAGSAGTALHKKFSDDAARQSMQAANYVAADYIAVQARHQIDKFTPIEIGAFKNIGDIPINDALGAAIGDQLGQRFAELGFTVGRNVEKTPGYYKRRNAILRGTYKVVRNDIKVNLLMVEEGSNKVFAQTTYDIPIKSDVRELGQLEDQSFLNMFTLPN